MTVFAVLCDILLDAGVDSSARAKGRPARGRAVARREKEARRLLAANGEVHGRVPPAAVLQSVSLRAIVLGADDSTLDVLLGRGAHLCAADRPQVVRVV